MLCLPEYTNRRAVVCVQWLTVFSGCRRWPSHINIRGVYTLHTGSQVANDPFLILIIKTHRRSGLPAARALKA